MLDTMFNYCLTIIFNTLLPILLGLMPLTLFSQDSSSVLLLKEIPLKSHFAETDRLQQIYIVSEDNTLKKFNIEGELLKTFNEISLGTISHIDVSNPFQILVYYKDYQTAIVLDRSLSELYRFNLSRLGHFQSDAVGLSSDNKLWIYDPNNFRLQKIDNNGNVELESPDLTAILYETFQPITLKELDFKIFLNDPKSGILVFDNFANYNQTLSLTEIPYFQVLGNFLVWMDSDFNIHKFHLKSFKDDFFSLKSFDITTDNLLQCIVTTDRLLLRYPDYLLLYKIIR